MYVSGVSESFMEKVCHEVTDRSGDATACHFRLFLEVVFRLPLRLPPSLPLRSQPT